MGRDILPPNGSAGRFSSMNSSWFILILCGLHGDDIGLSTGLEGSEGRLEDPCVLCASAIESDEGSREKQRGSGLRDGVARPPSDRDSAQGSPHFNDA
mmetsp:Transcript_12507/g.21717  ORF Transcript_12507/g.21717 Transcript_12507/m.21717 type:complete len:98 (+) Transcript_12507:3112-3405(+)